MELVFKKDTTLRRQLFIPESFVHPAKMNSYLLLWIVGRYTKPGEILLDPMAGIGTTMLGCNLGCNVILVELEEKFCKICQDNWEKIRQTPSPIQRGWCQIIQGDARQLTSIQCNIEQSDIVISSSPYAKSQVPPHTPEGEARRLKIAKERGVSPDKVSYMDYTRVDRIITSPPFAGNTGGLRSAESFKYGDDPVGKRMMGGIKGGTGSHPDNIDKLPYGEIDKIITSPPFKEQFLDTDWISKNRPRKHAGRHNPKEQDPNNIGNLKSDSYLSAMLQVYQQCYKVLKPDGLMILVTKDFTRNKQRIYLSLDTIALCEQAGFSFVERHYRKLTQQSFWRTIYYQKYPEVEKIEHEDILVFRKRE